MRRLIRIALVLVAVAASVAAASGCGASRASVGAPDKAGGGSAPVVVRLVFVSWVDNDADVALLKHFAERVRDLSRGRLRVRLAAAEYAAPDEERRVAEAVRDGSFELGWTSTRRWGRLGAPGFGALAVPFAVTGSGVADAVARGSLGVRLLDALDAYGVTGLALVPGALLHPSGARRYAAPPDFAGVQFLLPKAEATDAALEALGAVPRYTVASVRPTRDPPAALAPLGAGEAHVQTANVDLYAKFGTLFANPRALRRLSNEQRTALRAAAADLVRWAVAHTPSERAAARERCNRGGTIALASRSELVTLRRIALRANISLVRDRQAQAVLRDLRVLAATTPSDPPVATCSQLRAGASRAAGFGGTYRMTLTKDAAAAFGAPAARYPVSVTWTLRGGRWSLRGVGTYTGTYVVHGREVAFEWPRVGSTNRFTFTRARGGTVRLTPVGPMDPHDALAWAGHPWRRVGP